MKANDLNNLFDNKITIDCFKSSIDVEVDNYRRLMSKIGSSIELRLQKNEEIYLDKLRFKKLLELVISDQLSNVHLAYICDCLTLTDNLTTDQITMDLIFEIADPEINGGFLDKQALIKMASRLQ